MTLDKDTTQRHTNLEKRLSILPAGVVSKKLIGDRKIANAIRSCNFLEACPQNHVRIDLQHIWAA